MLNRKLILIIIGIFFLSLASAQNVSYCCEKTVGGAWCQNSPASNCNADFRKVPTSCEATSYCKLGTCYDSQEGTCMENTPQKVCEDNGGVWNEKAMDEVPQCGLGCCLIGDQAAFVTQTRCKRLSSVYGLEIDFRTSISSELQCVATATSEVKGACVFEKEFEQTCLLLSKKECAEMQTGNATKFYEGYLCSAEELATNCGPSEKTKCVEGKDEVYFVDSCGNLANVYDATKIKDKNYWSKIQRKDESCNPEDSNANSETCGNCDYYLGSTCKTFKSGKDKRPKYGDNICRDLSCKYEGEKYEHGETWCAESEGVDENLPGSRYFRMVCYNNEVNVEPCADFRQEVCLESDIDGFRTAACRVNKWQDCYAQTSKQECENADRRDCKWIKSLWTPKPGDESKIIRGNGACVPLFTPGFNFWEEGDTEELCSLADAKCVVKFEKGIVSKEKCVENCECLADSWKKNMNDICVSLGDCGSTTNYLGFKGYHD
ncbi:MAG: hypothetical protein ABIA78_02915 [archaeon]